MMPPKKRSLSAVCMLKAAQTAAVTCGMQCVAKRERFVAPITASLVAGVRVLTRLIPLAFARAIPLPTTASLMWVLW